jgi:hypothetical protein
VTAEQIRVYAFARVAMNPWTDWIRTHYESPAVLIVLVHRQERPWRQFVPAPVAHYLGDPMDMPDHDRVLDFGGQTSYLQGALTMPDSQPDTVLASFCRDMRQQLDGEHPIRPAYPFRP